MLTWIILRAAGIAAYLMLWATVSWGLIGTASLSGKKVARATAINVHQFLATTAFVLLGVHIGGLLLDTFVPFKPVDVLVPLHTTYQTLPVAFGIVAMYSLAIVLFSSWLRKHLSVRAWRALHLLAVPAFALALVHGVFAGTDTVRPWMWWGYVVTGGSVLFFTLARALTIGIRPTRAAPPPHARARAAESAPVVAAPMRARTPAAPARELASVGASAAGAGAATDAAVVAGDGSAGDPAPARARAPATGAQPTRVRPASPTRTDPAPVAPPPEAAPHDADDPPTVVVRLELVIEGDQTHGRRRVDVPVRLHGGTHAREHRPVHTERITTGPHAELGPPPRDESSEPEA